MLLARNLDMGIAIVGLKSFRQKARCKKAWKTFQLDLFLMVLLFLISLSIEVLKDDLSRFGDINKWWLIECFILFGLGCIVIWDLKKLSVWVTVLIFVCFFAAFCLRFIRKGDYTNHYFEFFLFTSFVCLYWFCALLFRGILKKPRVGMLVWERLKGILFELYDFYGFRFIWEKKLFPPLYDENGKKPKTIGIWLFAVYIGLFSIIS